MGVSLSKSPVRHQNIRRPCYACIAMSSLMRAAVCVSLKCKHSSNEPRPCTKTMHKDHAKRPCTPIMHCATYIPGVHSVADTFSKANTCRRTSAWSLATPVSFVEPLIPDGCRGVRGKGHFITSRACYPRGMNARHTTSRGACNACLQLRCEMLSAQ